MIEFMKQISVFMLLGKTLLYFCPGKKYEKYVKLLFGFMVILQFATPVLALGSGGTLEEYEKNKAVFEKQFARSMEAVEKKWFLYQEEIAKQIEKERVGAEKMVQKTQEEAGQKQKEGENAADKEEESADVEKVKIEVTIHE